MYDDRLVVAERAEAPLSREQKAGLFFVIVCGLGALVFGVQYVWAHMAKPFSVEYSGPRLTTGAEKQSADIAAQKAADTDSDGVSDYDELNIFKTSPYLADSDSDGQNDGAEINAGQDPNCALGANCDGGTISNSEAVGGQQSAEFLGDQATTSAAAAAQLQSSLDTLKNIPVEQIRTLLINAGASQEEVDAMSDEDVKALYDQLLSSLQDSGALQDLANQVLGSTSGATQ